MPSRDNAVIGRLIVQHRTALFAYLLASVRDHNDAEELFQEVAAAVITSFDKLRDEAEFLPWAREIARRQVLSFFRRSSRPMTYSTELVDLLASTDVEGSGGEAANRRTEALHECLDRLPRRSQEVIQMRYNGGVSRVDEIATKIGRSMAATYGILKRIRLALRSCLETKLASEDLR